MIKFQKITLTVEFYREGNKFIAFSPALNISTCGDTLEQAKKRFEELQQLFFEETGKMGTLEDALLECGWKKITHPHKCWKPPISVGQIQREVRVPCPA
jgi:predicted RNase H-like HicB family nuclease